MPADAVERALTLIVRMHGGDCASAEQARAELAAWRHAAPEHEQAFHEADRRWCATGGAATGLRGVIPKPRKPVRLIKNAAKSGVALCLMLAAGLLLRAWLALPVYEQQFATAVAQIASVDLPDGSRLTLDARTRLKVVLYRDRRTVQFDSGEAYFDVAANPAQPFSIQTRQGSVRVIGTAFTIRDRGDAVTVTVERGRVAVTSAGAAPESVDLTAGTRVVMDQGHIGEPEPAPAQFAPWRSGWLVFDNVPLSEVLPSINAYRRVPVVLADEQAGRLRLTGSFRNLDQESVLDLLPRALPVEVRRDGLGGAVITSRH